MAWGIANDELACRRCKVTPSHINGDALFTFGLQSICKCGQVWLLAIVGPVACVGCVGQLVAEYGFAVKEQSSNERALAVVHRATGDKCECIHVKNSLLLCVFP